LNPIIVRKRTTGGGYEIVSGHRRYEACKRLNKFDIPVIVRDLTDEEAQQIIRLYNHSRHGGEVTGTPCCAGYCVTIDLTNGSTITLSEGARDKAVLTGPGGRWHYLTNQALINYILELAEQYNLPKP
jgi:hypothetical protein